MTVFFHRLMASAPLKPRAWIERFVFWGGAIAIAGTAIVFAKMCAWGSSFFRAHFADNALPFLVTPVGLAFVVWATRRLFPGAEDSGIPLVVAAIEKPEIADRSSLLSPRIIVGKLFLTPLSLCLGASVGPEGPTVQIGASLMYMLGKRFGLDAPQMKRTLVLAGASAGLAAAFNTPLAGILFALEDLSHSFEERTSGIVLTTVIVAGIVSIAALGNYTYFGNTDVILDLAQAWKPVLLCGMIGGLFGGGFSRLLLFFSHGLPEKWQTFVSSHPALFAAGCGFVLAVLGFLSSQSIFGTGYNEARGLIEGHNSLPSSFGFLKILATAVSYISGIPGGIFAPSLAAGAGLGADLTSLLPDTPAQAVILLGMVGYFTGVVQVPITATIILMEMTSDQSLTLPLLATAFLAFVVSRAVCPESLYHGLSAVFLEKHKRRMDREAKEKEEDQSLV